MDATMKEAEARAEEAYAQVRNMTLSGGDAGRAQIVPILARHFAAAITDVRSEKPKTRGQEIAEKAIRAGRTEKEILIRYGEGLSIFHDTVSVEATYGARDSVLAGIRGLVAMMIDSAGADASFSHADQAREYLARVLVAVAPSVQPMRDLMGVCTQIDNVIAGLREGCPQSAAMLQADYERLRVREAVLGQELRESTELLDRLAAAAEPAGDSSFVKVDRSRVDHARLRAASNRVTLLAANR